MITIGAALHNLAVMPLLRAFSGYGNHHPSIRAGDEPGATTGSLLTFKERRQWQMDVAEPGMIVIPFKSELAGKEGRTRCPADRIL